MKTSSVTKVLPAIFTSLMLIYTSSPVLAWEPDWGDGYRYDNPWNNHNYQPLESIEYNGRIIRTGIRPRTDICSLVRAILGHCDGYIGFDESRRTHIFRNYPQQQYYQNNQWGNRQYHRDRRDSVPTWPRRRGCVYQDKNIRVLCD